MSTTIEQGQFVFTGVAEDEPDDNVDDRSDHGSTSPEIAQSEEPLRPINWNLLTADEAESEWLDLNAWAHWLRATYGLPPTVLPPYWHRHDELVWELSALHTHWLHAYDQDGTPSGPLTWHRDFAEARNRLREWVSTCGTRLDRDRATRLTTWPGEEPNESGAEVVIENREADFYAYVLDDIDARRRIAERAHNQICAS